MWSWSRATSPPRPSTRSSRPRASCCSPSSTASRRSSSRATTATSASRRRPRMRRWFEPWMGPARLATRPRGRRLPRPRDLSGPPLSSGRTPRGDPRRGAARRGWGPLRVPLPALPSPRERRCALRAAHPRAVQRQHRRVDAGADRRIHAVLHGHEHHGFGPPSSATGPIPILNPGSGYARIAAQDRRAHFNVYTVEDGALTDLRRLRFADGRFDPGGAYATGR